MRFRIILESTLLASVCSVTLSHSHHSILTDASDDVNERKLESVCNKDELKTFEDGVVGETVVSFIGMGDVPYFQHHRWCLNDQLRKIEEVGADGPSFMIHIGDIKSGKPHVPCDREAYNDIAEIFSHPDNAVNYNPRDCMFVPGDNEWNDCDDPDNAWDLWMEHFGPGNRYGFGDLTSGVPVLRHNDTYRKAGVDRSENFAFFLKNVLFVGVNVVGGGSLGDEGVRLKQNVNWIRRNLRAFNTPENDLKGIVVFGHAQLMDGARQKQFGEPLGKLAANYPNLPFMYFHGNGHTYCTRYLFKDAPNFVDVEVDDGDSAPPLKVSLVKHPKTGKHLWAVDRGTGRYADTGEKECPRIRVNTWTTADSDPAPTPKTLAPTPLPTVKPSEAIVLPPPKPRLKYIEKPKKSMFPLEECEGRCTKNADCKGDLVCFKRAGKNAKIPGCLGKPKWGKNYCYNGPEQIPTPPPTSSPTGSPTPLPTESPTPGKTDSPTPAPTIQSTLVQKGDPVLDYLGGSPKEYFPLQNCQGDCDNDNQCAAGLYCLETKVGDVVPGCSGKPNGKDFCVEVPPDRLAKLGDQGEPAHYFPLAACRGDCDDNSDCQPGLRCFKRKSYERVPGCKGAGERGDDYCYDPKWKKNKGTARPPAPAPKTPEPTVKVLPPPKEDTRPKLVYVANAPSPVFPLGACEGDCDNDSQCQRGLRCMERKGKNQPVKQCRGKPEDGVDYCVPYPEGTLAYVYNNGDSLHHIPLGKCRGDCDDDIDCDKGLKCFVRKNLEPVPGCKGLGHEGKDYCYDPNDK